jgi:hypothetical protein
MTSHDNVGIAMNNLICFLETRHVDFHAIRNTNE